MDMGFTLKHYLVVLVMTSFCCKLTMAGWLFPETTVVIKNDFRSNEKHYLYVHCHTDDSDLGEQWLDRGQKYSWSFDINFWDFKAYDCYAQWGNKKKAFRAYDFDLYLCCHRGETTVWSLNDDGLRAFKEKKSEDTVLMFFDRWD